MNIEIRVNRYNNTIKTVTIWTNEQLLEKTFYGWFGSWIQNRAIRNFVKDAKATILENEKVIGIQTSQGEKE